MKREALVLAEACEELLEALSRKKRTRILAGMEKPLEAAMAKAFRAQGRAFAAEWRKLRPLGESGRLQEAITDSDWFEGWKRAAGKTLKLFTGPIDRWTRAALKAGAAEVVAEAKGGIAFDLKDPGAVAFLKDRAADQVAKVNDTTKARLRTIITNGQAKGLGHGEIAKQIAAEFEAFAVGRPQAHVDSRAHLVAITEVGEAYSEGTLQAAAKAEAAGIPQEKYWQNSGDARVSDGCRANTGAGWIPLADTFPSGHERPLRFPGCRCNLLTRRKKKR